MTTSIGNSKVYHFLARTGRDWQKHADKNYGNSDGVVSYNEFVSFIKSEFSNTMNGDVLSNADLNIFWNSVDTDKVDFKNHGKTVKGANNLNAAEIEAMDADLNDYIDLETIYAQALKLNPFSANNSDKQFVTSWNNMVSSMLREELLAWQKAGRPEEKTFALYMSKQGRTEKVYKEATAYVAKDQKIADLKAGAFGKLAEMGYDIETDRGIQNLVIQYIEKMPDFGDKPISEVLQQIIGDIEDKIEKYLIEVKKVGLGGEPGEVGPNDIPTDAQIAALQVELENKINDAINLLYTYIPNAAKYPNEVQKFVDEYRLGLVDKYNIYTSEGYNALKNLTSVQIAGEIKEPLIAVIKEAEAWAEFETSIKEKINNGELTNAILDEVASQELKDIITNGKILEAIQSDILARVREFGTYADGKVDVDEAWAKILVEAKELVATKLVDNHQNGYNVRGVEADTKEYKAFGLYSDLNTLLNSFITDETKRNEQYAKIALGYFKDVANRGYSDVVKDVVGVNVSALNVEDLAAEGKDKVSGWVAEVHTAILKKIANDKNANGTNNDDTVGNVNDFKYNANSEYVTSGKITTHKMDETREAAKRAVKVLIADIAKQMSAAGLDRVAIEYAVSKTTTDMDDYIEGISDQNKRDKTSSFTDGTMWTQKTRDRESKLDLVPSEMTPFILLENSMGKNSFEIRIDNEFVVNRMKKHYSEALNDSTKTTDITKDEVINNKSVDEFTYSGEAVITSGKDDSHSMSTVRNFAKSAVTKSLTSIAEAMKQAGLDGTKVDNAKTKALQHMSSFIEAVKDKGGRNHEETVTLDNGQTVSWAKQRRDRDKKLDMQPSNSYPVVLRENTGSGNYFEILISTDYLVNLMKQFYKAS